MGSKQAKNTLNFAGGIAVNALGHWSSELVEALTEQGNKLWHLSKCANHEPRLALAKKLTDATFGRNVFYFA